MADPGDDRPHDEARAADRAEDERLVQALRGGDPDAFGRLYDRWFDRVHDLARRITRDDGLAADVAQDAFLAAWQRLDGLDDPAAFGGWLLRIARNRALDVVRSAGHRRTEAVAEVTDERAVADRIQAGADPVALAEDREVQSLVWGAAEALGERDLTALDLHLRHGLEPAEIGEVLGINRNAANQLVHRMRGRLSTAVSCRVLWDAGRPRCATLRRQLADEGVAAFDARAVRLTDRHAASCDACARRRELRLDPAKLFAAMPIPVVGLAVKQQAAAALAGAGVPMGGSSVAGGPGGSSSGHEGGPDVVSGDGGGRDGDGGNDRGGPASRRRRALALGALVAIALLVVLALGVERLDDGGLPSSEQTTAAIEPAPTTTTTPIEEGGMTLTTTASTVPPAAGGTPADGAAADTADGDAVLDPGIAPPTPAADDPVVVTAPPPPPTEGSLSASPGRVAPVHPNGQIVVSWSTAGASSVSVTGPGLSSSAASGRQGVCPGTVVSSVCRVPAGTYTYRLTATGPGGTVERTASVTVA